MDRLEQIGARGSMYAGSQPLSEHCLDLKRSEAGTLPVHRPGSGVVKSKLSAYAFLVVPPHSNF